MYDNQNGQHYVTWIVAEGEPHQRFQLGLGLGLAYGHCTSVLLVAAAAAVAAFVCY